MRFNIDIKKRHAFAILGVIFLVGTVIAYGSTQQPSVIGHTAGEIDIGIIGQTLQNWAVATEGRVDALEASGGSGDVQVIEGPEVYAGNFQWNPGTPGGAINTYVSSNIPKSYSNGISKIRFRWRNTGSTTAFICPQDTDIICGNGNPAGPGSWSCTCTQPDGASGGQSSTLISGSSSCNPAGSGFTNWVTFNVQGGATSIWLDGFSGITTEFCHASNGLGTADIDVYVTPYVLRTSSGYRIGQPNSI